MAITKFTISDTEYRRRLVYPTSPEYSAGTGAASIKEVIITCPVGAAWMFIAANSSAVNTATVGNRTPKIVIYLAGGTQVYNRISSGAFAASTTWRVNYGLGIGDTTSTITNTVNVITPPVILQEGDYLSFQYQTGVDAADTHVINVAMFKEFII